MLLFYLIFTDHIHSMAEGYFFTSLFLETEEGGGMDAWLVWGWSDQEYEWYGQGGVWSGRREGWSSQRGWVVWLDGGCGQRKVPSQVPGHSIHPPLTRQASATLPLTRQVSTLSPL